MVCPACGASVSPGQERCPRCPGEPPPVLADRPRAMEAASGDAGACARRPTPPGAVPLCGEHQLPAAGTCGRCGTFYCTHCVPDLTAGLCPRCESIEALRELSERIRRCFRELWMSTLILGLGILSLMLVPEILQGRMRWPRELLLGGLLLGLPFLLLAFLLRLTRSLTVAWLAVGAELLLATFAFTLTGVHPLSVVIGIVPLATVLRIGHIRRLRGQLAGGRVEAGATAE